ncbi:peptidoglycan recognition protein family protein [Pseudomonas putida]|uniref:Endolysin n=1 Tax=Staphylococcus phage Andhra TaxID=1958907 RepID=A0A1S6L1H5_9CAUD|nr:endolysin [Staphylococcus phage Andhra]AQT27836.1 endolysin [Staphylococcus phage Andhra]
MKNIYSNHIKGQKLTGLKPSIDGVVIHNDYGSMTPSQYLNWLYSREQNGSYTAGWASVYVNRNETLWYHPTNYIEWHCGNNYANSHLIGFEVCESFPNHISDETFMKNEEATFKVVADVMKSYKLPINRNTVHLHREYFSTSCPHRSWAIHVGVGAPNTRANQLKLIDYFISRIKHYANGGKTPDKPQVSENKYVKYNWRGTFTAHKTNTLPIVPRYDYGMSAKEVDKDSYIQPNEYVPFYQIIKDKQAKLWWIKFKYAKKGSSKQFFYMPIGKIEDKHEKILNEKHLWGKLEVEKHGK